MKNNFWKNKKILITGHTGFKGSWLTLILHGLGSKITGYALNPISKPNFFDGLNLSRFLHKDYRNNILNFKKLKSVILKEKPQIIFHLAAQSSVLESYKTPISTINSNVLGTANLLEAIKFSKTVKSLVIATTDKVYLNLEEKKPFNENDKLGGHDLYSGSKAAAEIITQSFTKSFFSKKNCNIATVRSGNCIGGGDWTKDRIVKDCAESFLRNKKLIIRSPNATRPWQHVIEPLFGYLNLSKKLYFNKKFSGAWNFGPKTKNSLKVKEVAFFGKNILNSKSKILFRKNKYYESTNLSLNSAKSRRLLKWKTVLTAKESLKLSFDWYKFYHENRSKSKVIDYTLSQIRKYKKKIKIYEM
jgi:CDP-glucose 4,6-dehydratase